MTIMADQVVLIRIDGLSDINNQTLALIICLRQSLTDITIIKKILNAFKKESFCGV